MSIIFKINEILFFRIEIIHHVRSNHCNKQFVPDDQPTKIISINKRNRSTFSCNKITSGTLYHFNFSSSIKFYIF